MTAVGLGPLAGRYRLDARLAIGGMGEVWRGLDTVLDRPVAVKTLRDEYAGDDEFLERFRAEARHAGSLSHVGIASVYDYGEEDLPEGRSAWLVMELVEGEPLSEALQRGPLGVDATLDVVAQVGLALAAAHEAGVVHRDVKPGNLLVRPDGVVKVTDFGIAHADQGPDGSEPGTGLVVGTAYYLSPEQAAGHAGTPASDLYALGVVAYECLTGIRPFAGPSATAVGEAHRWEPPPPLPVSVPQPVRDLVAALLAKDPADRPADAGGVARAAQALRADLPADPRSGLRDEPVPQPPTLPPTRRSPSALRHGRALRLAATLLVVLGLGLGARAFLLAPSTAVVPALPPGMQASVAFTELSEAGLRPGPSRSVASADVPAGTVLGSDPPPGSRVSRDTPVSLLISTGRTAGPGTGTR